MAPHSSQSPIPISDLSRDTADLGLEVGSVKSEMEYLKVYISTKYSWNVLFGHIWKDICRQTRIS